MLQKRKRKNGRPKRITFSLDEAKEIDRILSDLECDIQTAQRELQGIDTHEHSRSLSHAYNSLSRWPLGVWKCISDRLTVKRISNGHNSLRFLMRETNMDKVNITTLIVPEIEE